MTEITVLLLNCKYRQFNLIQEQQTNFILQKFGYIFKNILNSDENVRILSVYY